MTVVWDFINLDCINLHTCFSWILNFKKCVFKKNLAGSWYFRILKFGCIVLWCYKMYKFLLCEVPQILSAYVILLWSFFTPFLSVTQLFNQPILSQIRNFVMPTVYKVFFFQIWCCYCLTHSLLYEGNISIFLLKKSFFYPFHKVLVGWLQGFCNLPICAATSCVSTYFKSFAWDILAQVDSWWDLC